jgi:hypothetical protein
MAEAAAEAARARGARPCCGTQTEQQPQPQAGADGAAVAGDAGGAATAEEVDQLQTEHSASITPAPHPCPPASFPDEIASWGGGGASSGGSVCAFVWPGRRCS